jgi:hypothetical protein
LAAQDAGELPGGLGTRNPEGRFGAAQGDMVEKPQSIDIKVLRVPQVRPCFSCR